MSSFKARHEGRRNDEGPARLIGEWAKERLPSLSDPANARRTLEWLFARSVRGLDETARQVLAAAALLARAPFPLAAMSAAFPKATEEILRRSVKDLVHSSLLRRAEEEDCWQFTHVLSYQFARRETGSDVEVRTRLGEWLQRSLAADLAVGAPAMDALALTRRLEHVGALLRTDEDQVLWAPLVYPLLYGFYERLTDLGRLALVKLALGGVAGWWERFPPGKAQETYWARERTSLIDRQGNVLSAQGDLTGALAAYRESLAVMRGLAEADRSNAGSQRDLGAAHCMVGIVLEAQGDLPGALVAYQEYLQVMRGLAEADRSNAGWQRDLSVSLDNIGNVLRAQGDLTGALAAYRESLAVSRGLAEADRSNAGWQRDLSVSLTKISETLDRQGDRAEALRLAEESLAIDERLASLDASNATWRKDVEISRGLVAWLRGKGASGGL